MSVSARMATLLILAVVLAVGIAMAPDSQAKKFAPSQPGTWVPNYHTPVGSGSSSPDCPSSPTTRICADWEVAQTGEKFSCCIAPGDLGGTDPWACAAWR